MVIKKVDRASNIHIVYSTSGPLDVRCPTHEAVFRKSDREINGNVTEAGEVISDVSSIPVVRLSNDVIYHSPIAISPKNPQKPVIRYRVLVRQYILTEEAYNYWNILPKSTETEIQLLGLGAWWRS
jgi:hypothetical protein